MIILNDILDYLKDKDKVHVQGLYIVMYEWDKDEVDKALLYGFETHKLKRLTSNKGVFWSINKEKVKRVYKKRFTRPNYGITQRLKEVINSKEFRCRLVTTDTLLNEVKSDFKKASPELVDRTIQHWIRDGKPGIEKKVLGDQTTYIFKQLLR